MPLCHCSLCTLWHAIVNLYHTRRAHTHTDNHGYIYIYVYTCQPPLKPTGFSFYCVLQWFLLVFAFKSSQHFFHLFEDFGCLIMMSHDASCVDTMTYFDSICSVFDYRIVFPTKGLNSNIDRMRTALWPSFTLVFTVVLFLFLTHEILDFVCFQI